MKKRMLAMRGQGIGYPTIARELGVTINTVRYHTDDEWRERWKEWMRQYAAARRLKKILKEDAA